MLSVWLTRSSPRKEAGMFARSTARCAAIALCCSVAHAGAQRSPAVANGYVVTGTVADPDGNPIAEAEVSVVDHDIASRFVRSDENGRFRIEAFTHDTATLRVRHFGFHARIIPVRIARDRTTTLFVKLEQATNTLDPVRVEGEGADEMSMRLKEFYARAGTNHFGHFIDEQTLDDLRPTHTSDALRTIPGVVIRPSRRIGNQVRIRGCAPLVWVDGLRAPGAELDDVTSGTDVAAIEVYNSLAGVPAQYTDRTATCGTILVWLKTR
jgi:hypothetical protein